MKGANRTRHAETKLSEKDSYLHEQQCQRKQPEGAGSTEGTGLDGEGKRATGGRVSLKEKACKPAKRGMDKTENAFVKNKEG